MDLGHELTEKQLQKLENELKVIYNKVYRECKRDLDKVQDILDKYSDDLTEKDRIKLWNRKDRLDNLIKSMVNEIRTANITSAGMLNNELINVYELNYNYGAFTVENLSGKEIYSNLYNRNTIKAILSEETNPFTKIALNNAKDKDLIYRLLKREFAAAIVKGDSIQDIAKRVKKVTQKNYYDSVRIARTETTRLQSMGRQDSFKQGEEMGLKLEKRWVSTNDSRTRDRHLEMQGETVPLDEKFSNGLEYPSSLGGKPSEVCNCRCTHVVEFIGLKKSAKLQDLEKEVADLNFKEWERRKNERRKNE